MKFLIVGRSGVGKDALAQELVRSGMKQVISYTTRPKRYAGEKTHIFVTREEAASLTDRFAETQVNGYEYFTTRKQVEESDVYIVDPKGFFEVIDKMPDTEFALIHVTADAMASRTAATKRSDDPAKEAGIWHARRKAEHEQFVRFENYIENYIDRARRNTECEQFTGFKYYMLLRKNCRHVIEIGNDFTHGQKWKHAIASILWLYQEHTPGTMLRLYQEHKPGISFGAFTVDVKKQEDGLYSIYMAREGSSGEHYRNVTADRIRELVIGLADCVTESKKEES